MQVLGLLDSIIQQEGREKKREIRPHYPAICFKSTHVAEAVICLLESIQIGLNKRESLNDKIQNCSKQNTGRQNRVQETTKPLYTNA